MIFKYEFSQKYNTFINNFNKFERIQGKMLLKYGKELRRIIKKISSIPSGSQSGEGLKVLTPQQMFTRLPILLAQIKAGNNS